MDIRRRAQIGGIKKTSSGGGSTTGGTYTVNLNGQWEATTAVPNPDSTLYDGVYRSSSNYNVNGGVAIMYITIKDCSSFKMYIRSYAESNYDYVMVSQLDQAINGNTSYSDTTLVKAHTRGNQQSGTALSSYTLVEFTGISSGEHTITVVYRKDNSVNSNDDRGYILISKSNGGSGSDSGGDDEGGSSEGPINTDNYMTILALENGLTAKLSTNACEYCVDGDGNWKSLTAGTTTQSINSGQTLSFKGNLTPNSSSGIGTFTISKKCNLEGNCMSLLFGDNAVNNISLSGKTRAFYRLFYNCTSIIQVSETFLPATTLANYCYSYMFSSCTNLTTAPELPATTLTDYCYSGMFDGCTSLTTAPALPATTLASYCYYFMFDGCTSLTTAPALPAARLASSCYNNMFNGCSGLTTAPALPATTLASSCYRSMFDDCSGLTTAPALPATKLANYCYSSMFYGCTSLTTAPALPAARLASSCYQSMFDGCTSLTQAPALPATTLDSSCYNSMFFGCSKLTSAPELPATTLANNCYSYMFYNCSKLNYIKMLATDISANNCLSSWVNGVSSTGTFVKNPAMTSLPTGTSGIPRDWTVVDDGEEPINTDNYLTILALENGLTAKLSDNACQYCIDGDGNWVDLPAGTTTESINSGQTLSFRGNLTPKSYSGIGTFTISTTCNLEGNCMSLLFGDDAVNNNSLSGKKYAFYGLFSGCTSIIQVSETFLPATTLANYCYYEMFYGCTSLTTAPELPATTLASDCYRYMFRGCTSLTVAPELPATTLARSCYSNMFNGCTSLTVAPELPATTLDSNCYYEMFSGCTSLTVAPELPATKLADYCYGYMFNGCTSLTTAPELPATTLDSNCYRNMFNGCTSLTTAPALPATKLASYCYYYMFYGCTSLTTAPELPATTLADYCYQSMFQKCTSLTVAPELPATTLASLCYYEMFYGCSKLNYIKMLATDISANNCLSSWVNGVSSTGTFVKNPAMTSLPTGTSGIPRDWTVVDDGEESVNLITFTFEDAGGDIHNMSAESGMTWQDFVNSAYNNGDFSIGRFMGWNDVALCYGSPIYSSDDVMQYATNTITANGSYYE